MTVLKISTFLAVSLLAFSTLQAAYAQTAPFETKGVYLYQDDSGRVIIGGVIENISDTPRGSVEISITLYDQDKKVIGLATSSTHVDTIHPSQISSFQNVLRDQIDISRIRSWNMTIHSEQVDAKVRNLKLIVDESRLDPRGVYFVEGSVTNTGNTTANLVKVSAAFYDQNDQVVASAFALASPQNLEPGQTAPFQLVVMDNPNSKDVFYASLNVESIEYTIVPEFSIFIIALFGSIMGLAIMVTRSNFCRFSF